MEKQEQNNNFADLSDVMSPVEVDEITEDLNQYIVKYPDEHNINKTINTLRQYVPSKQQQSQKRTEYFQTLIKRSLTEITLISKTYWVASAILFILGYFVMNYAHYNPLYTLMILAPIPFVFGLLEVFKGREQGMLEIEMTCKFSSHEIMLTRLVLIGIYNLILNTILTISLMSLIETSSMWQLLLTWFTPFIFFASLSLWLSMKFRGSVFITMIISLWMVFSFLIISQHSWIELMLHLNMGFYIVFLGIGILLFSFQMKQLIYRYSSYEGVEKFETSY